MIGTLVVTLPSSHTDGQLIVEHRGESCARLVEGLAVVHGLLRRLSPRG
jgi:hypothetical protein